MEKLRIATYTSEVDEEYAKLQDKRTRRTRHVNKMSDSSTDNSTEEEEPVRKKIKKENFPQLENTEFFALSFEKTAKSVKKPPIERTKKLTSLVFHQN